ncbi:MAG: sel1 repeat family protein [Bacteroidales bacterium]|nr:sel1 repeat family protein [Bacteroidales bacterium]
MKNRTTMTKILCSAIFVFSFFMTQTKAQNLELKARTGNVNSMYLLAEEYYKGIGRLQDYKQAFVWYKQAADKNNLEACYKTAAMYEEGKGCTQNYTNAFNYYLKAAERGHEASQLKAALMLDAGLGTKRSVSRAYIWYRICAEREEGLAQRRIADCYLTGEVVQEDWQEAVYWYEKAVNNNDTVAMAYLGYILSSNGAIAPDYERAYSLTQAALEKDIPMAHYVYALFLENGYQGEKNEKEALKYYKKASEGGILQAIEVMAIENYRKTRDISSILSLKTLSRSESYLIIAREYESGELIKKNVKKANDCYKQAAAMGNTEAQEYLESKKTSKKRR